MKLKIVNKKKFVRMVIFTLIIILVIVFAITTKVFSYQEKSYRKIYVESGDTLWSIAKYEQENNCNYQNSDIRKIINDIKSINNLENAELKVGQSLLILN